MMLTRVIQEIICKSKIYFIGSGRVAIILDGVDFGMVGGRRK